MARLDLSTPENLIRIGVLVVLVSLNFLMSGAFEGAAKMFFWMALIILSLETVRTVSVSIANAALVEIIFAVAFITGAGRALFEAVGKTFTESHLFLIVFIVGGLIILYGAYRKFVFAPSDGK